MTRERRAAVLWALAGAAVLAWLGARWLRPPLLHGGWRALWVDVEGAPATDETVERLNQKLERLAAWGELRNSERLGFAFFGGRVRASAKVLGDDWDLAIYLRALQQLSAGEPAIVFKIDSEPEGEKFELRGGSFGARARAAAAFLDEHAATRPNWEGRITSITVEGPGDPAAVRAAVERQLAADPLEHLARPIDYAAAPAGVKLSATTDGDVRTATRLIAVFQLALTQGANSLDQPVYLVTLDGKERRVARMLGFDDWFRLRGELEQAVGPTPPWRSPEPARPKIPPAPRVLGRHPEAAPLLGGRALIWRAANGETTRLGADGTLETLGEIPLLRSADGKWALYSPPGDGDRLAPADGGAGAPLPALLPGQIRRAIAFAGARLLAVEITELRLGRIAERIALYSAGEPPRTSDIFYNLQGPVVSPSGDHALFTAELDGKEKLVRVELPSLKWTAEERWPATLRVRTLVPADGGRAALVLESPTPARPRVEVLGLDDGGVTRPIGSGIDGWFLRALGEQWILVQGSDHATAVWRVDLDADRLDRPNLPGGAPAAIAHAGARTVVEDEHGVQILDGANAWSLAGVPERPRTVALSQSGALAVLPWTDHAARLLLATDDHHQLAIDLPAGGHQLRWLAPNDPPAWR